MRDEPTLQAVVDQAPQAQAYYSDGFVADRDLAYGPATDTAMTNKSQTYTVAGGNADVRHTHRPLGAPLPLFLALYPRLAVRHQACGVVLQSPSTLEAPLS